MTSGKRSSRPVPLPSRKREWVRRVTPQVVCGCGYVARAELMDEHQARYRYRGRHSSREPFEPKNPDAK